MAHPDLLRAGDAVEQGAGRAGAVRRQVQRGQAVLALDAQLNRPAQQMGHELLAVADAQHPCAALKNGGIDSGASRIVNAVGAAGDDQPPRAGEIGRRSFAGADLGIHPQIANFARDQVTVLAPGIQDDDLGGGFHLAAKGASGCMRLTMTLRTESSSALALGRASTACSTSGSVSTATRSLSSILKAVMYISRLKKRLI